MRIKALIPFIIIGFILALTFHFIALAAIDAPHNECNNVNCGNCHGQGLLQSPFWGGNGTYDQICQSCHTALSGPYSEISAPFTQTHSSENTSNKYGDWYWECRDCHDPHYQKQKNFKNIDASNLYLATGIIDSCFYNGDNTSTLTYASIIYKSGWNAEKLIDKTQKGGNDKRSAILFPNVKKLGFSYPIIGTDEVAKTITVKGDATLAYEYISPPTEFAAIYGQYIKDSINCEDIWEDIEISLGSGMDGPITINSEKNINIDIIAGGRSYPDGISWQITDNISSDQKTISSGLSRPGGFAIGDEIIIINLKGTPADYSDVGLYEYGTIEALPNSNSISVDSNLTNSYDGTTQKIMVQRVPHYTDVTIETGGLLTCDAFDGDKGGVLAFRASGTVTINAYDGISASGKGFRGGLGVAPTQNAGGGETYNGTGGVGGVQGDSGQAGQGGGGGAGGFNGGSGALGNIGGGGGGGGGTVWNNPGGGGGGSYSSLGAGGAGGGDIGGDGSTGVGTMGGFGGNNISGSYKSGGGGGGGIYGINDLSKRLYLGSGGGAGGGESDFNVSNGGNGGNGGGIIYFFTNTVNINSGGSITSNGNNGANGPIPDCYGSSAGGGGGSGGSIAVFFTNKLNNSGSISAIGGIGGLFFRCTSCFASSCSVYSPVTSGGEGGAGKWRSYFIQTSAEVKFFDNEGENSFADGDTTYNSICEICHTQTNHFRNDGNASDQNHTNLDDDIAGMNCTACHTHNGGFFEVSSGCLECHSAPQGGRAAITTQFSGNSHHIQGITVTDSHCYQCHWEANSDGSVNNAYHEGYNSVTKITIPDDKVDLVVYTEGARPTTYASGTTAIQYTADGTRAEVKKINSHCLSCHSEQHDSIMPFGDGKTPKQYAWDGKSIDERYSQDGKLIGLRWNTSSSSEEFGVINTTTGSFTVRGTVGDLEAWSSPSIISGNTLYVSGTNSSAQDKLYILNTTTGSLISSVNLSTDGLILSGFNGSGNLIAMRWNTSSSKYEFGAINATNGNFTVKGTVGDLEAWSSPSIISGDILYVSGVNSANNDKLYTLNTTDGSLISTVNLNNDGLVLSGSGCINSGITTWGKYGGGRFTPKNTQIKAYSAHGNAVNNQGGWDLSETWSNTRNGTENVACFDCHNSHGSNVSGTTTSYTSATTNGGILKDTIAGKGGYLITYKPQAGGSESNKNAYNAGAGLCFDCHLTASSSITPWGYNSSFGATQAIIGYWDTPYFGPGTFASKQRFNYKATPHQGGHFGASSNLSSPASNTILLMHMDEALWNGTPDEVIDSSPAGNNNGTAYNSDTIAGGKYGRAGSFYGSDSYVDLTMSSLNGISNWTLSTWIYPLNSTTSFIYSEGNPNATLMIRYQANGSLLINTWHASRDGYWMTYTTPAGVISPNSWNFIAVVLANSDINTGDVTVYVNENSYSGTLGNEYNSSTQYATIGQNVGSTHGGTQGSFPFYGYIDEVVIYSSALSEEVIETIYQQGEPPPVVTSEIGGLCTKCHDPHGVSPALGDNMTYSVPLLKGTWLTSLYREDYTPVNDSPGTIRTDRGKEGVHYRIDQNTFGSDINSVVTGITQTESQFAGLCLNCHPKNSLTGITHTWKSKERVHESVKGWKTANTTIQHNFACSKCHSPHNSRLPRLMVTNCLDSRHKGLKTNNTNPKDSGYSSGSSYNNQPVTCGAYAVILGFCPDGQHPDPGHDCRGGSSGSSMGSGGKPGDWTSGVCGEPIPRHNVTCHESHDSHQYWNSKTPWTQ